MAVTVFQGSLNTGGCSDEVREIDNYNVWILLPLVICRASGCQACCAAYGLVEDGTVTNERQASFLEDFLKLADPRLAHRVQPSQRRLGDSGDKSREQGDAGAGSRR